MKSDLSIKKENDNLKILNPVSRGCWYLVVIGKAKDIQKYAQKNMETLRGDWKNERC